MLTMYQHTRRQRITHPRVFVTAQRVLELLGHPLHLLVVSGLRLLQALTQRGLFLGRHGVRMTKLRGELLSGLGLDKGRQSTSYLYKKRALSKYIEMQLSRQGKRYM